MRLGLHGRLVVAIALLPGPGTAAAGEPQGPRDPREPRARQRDSTASRNATPAQRPSSEPLDDRGWDALAMSRYRAGDLSGALAAWNRIGRPRVDAIAIE